MCSLTKLDSLGEEAVDDVDDAADPKAAIIDLLVAAAASAAGAAAFCGEPDHLDRLSQLSPKNADCRIP